MRNTIMFIVGCSMLCASLPAQEHPRQLKGGGHVLAEAAGQFFSEGHDGEVLRACQAGDWKNVDASSKKKAKNICAIQAAANRQATSGARVEYKGSGDRETMREDTFVFDGGYLVRIGMVYRAALADIQGYHPKSFDELFTGLKVAYGPPTKFYTEPVLNAYGVKYDAHHAIWMGEQDVILIIEQPGASGSTEIVAETLAEYNRAAQAPKTENPLQP